METAQQISPEAFLSSDLGNVPIPVRMENTGYTCAECGKPVDPDSSYIMSVPVGREPLYHHPACIGLEPY
jgi:hypothetical protein